MSPTLQVVECGPATGIQDGGRLGFQRQGLSPSGAMDPVALAAANALVGNTAWEAAVELALVGGRFRASGGPIRLALAGAPLTLRVDGTPVADHRSFTLPDGGKLSVGPSPAGVFAYLAARGGFAIPEQLGSRSLHARAALGGLDGRPLRARDRIPLRETLQAGGEHALPSLPLDAEEPLRVVLGPQADHFTPEGIARFLESTFTVSHRADRMGIQLDGPEIAHGPQGFNIVSDATVAGSVQVPGSGRPIVLMADRQTTGGYPKIAAVISADLRRLAQRRTGQPVRFRAVEVEEAVAIARAHAAWISGLPDRLAPVLSDQERLLRANLAGDAVDALG